MTSVLMTLHSPETHLWPFLHWELSLLGRQRCKHLQRLKPGLRHSCLSFPFLLRLQMPPETWRKWGFFVAFISFSEMGVLHCNPGWFETHCGDLLGLKLVVMPLPSLPRAEITDRSQYTPLEELSRQSHPPQIPGHITVIQAVRMSLGKTDLLTSLSYSVVWQRACVY